MKALKGSFINRARKAINAGCDIVSLEPNISNALKSCEGAGYASKNAYEKNKRTEDI